MKLNVISLYTGAGGLDLGLEAAAFDLSPPHERGSIPGLAEDGYET